MRAHADTQWCILAMEPRGSLETARAALCLASPQGKGHVHGQPAQAQHSAVQVRRSAVDLQDKGGQMRRVMLPLVDLLGHGDPIRGNVETSQGTDGNVYVHALRKISMGEEVRRC